MMQAITSANLLHRYVGHCIAALALAAFPLCSWADDGQPRYVSGAGRDSGDCRNKFRPCRTLDYAIAQAGKGDFVHVADGEYELHTAEQLTNLIAMHGRLTAGYGRHTGFSERNASDETLLIGVPPELRQRFEQSGFTVITDTKSFAVDAVEKKRIGELTATVLESEKSHTSAPCISNSSSGFACQNVSLHAHLSLSQLRPSSARGNDVWGFTDLNTGREYAIMGLQNGVAIVDVTDPQTPEQVAYAMGSATTWRDIKVYQRYDATAKRWRAYAYVSADAIDDFLMLLDLSNLPNGIERVGYSSDFRAAHNAYLVNADYAFGLAETSDTPVLSIAGAGISGGRNRLYSLAQPRSPQLQSVSTGGYAHDVGSFPIRDSRKNTQCVNAASASACQVVADFNENTIDIWDVTDPISPRMLSSRNYPNASYVHSGWWSEDGRYLFAHDEMDESNVGVNTTVRVFDMNNLAAPVLAGSWVGPTRAIDHNGFVKGNRYYVSNYTAGLTVLDLTTPTAPQRVGYFDTYPASNQVGYSGAWGAYPFFPSGTIAVGDIQSGLYLLRDETLASTNGMLAFAGPTATGTEGQNTTLTVRRTGGSAGAVSAQVDILHASTDASDATLVTQSVAWADGDVADKSVALTINSDAAAEGLERLIVRLRNPQGGATFSYPDIAQIYIADSGASTRLRLLQSALDVDEVRAKVQIVVTRDNTAAGESRVSFRTLPPSGYSGFTAQTGELIWNDGDGSAKIVTIALDPNTLSGGQSGSFQVEFFGPIGAELETDAGAAATTLTASVTVTDSATPAPPNPGSSGGGGGGGRIAPMLLAALMLMSIPFFGAVSRRSRAARGH